MMPIATTRVVSLLLVLFGGGCQTSDPSPDGAVSEIKVELPSKPRAIPVAGATVVPESFTAELQADEYDFIIVPKGMLSIAEVNRKHAELRNGPGAQFELQDKMLPRGSQVMVFNKIGVWRKVVVLQTAESGWMHYQALSEPQLNKIPMRVHLSRLPTVLVLRDLASVQTYPSQSDAPTTLPKGTMFRALFQSDHSTLVWVPKTRSVMWLSKKDVQ